MRDDSLDLQIYYHLPLCYEWLGPISLSASDWLELANKSTWVFQATEILNLGPYSLKVQYFHIKRYLNFPLFKFVWDDYTFCECYWRKTSDFGLFWYDCQAV